MGVSIRFEVRGGFRLTALLASYPVLVEFQSALRFAVVSDVGMRYQWHQEFLFQSALRFAVVSDPTP